MTHDEFWDLYSDGKIQVKIWEGVVDGVEKSIEAFEYERKYYLRIHTIYNYTREHSVRGQRYRMSQESHFIKEFENKNYANSYFKKASEGLQRVF